MKDTTKSPSLSPQERKKEKKKKENKKNKGKCSSTFNHKVQPAELCKTVLGIVTITVISSLLYMYMCICPFNKILLYHHHHHHHLVQCEKIITIINKKNSINYHEQKGLSSNKIFYLIFLTFSYIQADTHGDDKAC